MRQERPRVLGLACSHNGAACLLIGDRIEAAVQEERLTRRKRDRLHGALPSLSVPYCLQAGELNPSDLDMVVACVQGEVTSPLQDIRLNPDLRPVTHGVPVRVIPHHLGHAVGTFATSGFDDAAVLVIDGLGSPYEDLLPDERRAVVDEVERGWEVISLYRAQGSALIPLEKHLVKGGAWLSGDLGGMRHFGSLGGMFAAASWRIFGDHAQAGKVMALAALGTPTIPVTDFFEIDDRRLVFKHDVPSRFRGRDGWGTPSPPRELADLAASVQRALEDAVVWLGRRLFEMADSRNLCYAGGVALNVLANERLARETGFQRVHVMPAAEDSGTAIGAAYYGLWELTGVNARYRIAQDSVGRPYSADDIDQAAVAFPAIVRRSAPDLAGEVADRLCAGQILGWFQGGSELGPRALGQRSILADPRQAEARVRLNSCIKDRQPFQPLAPVVLLEHCADWFELGDAPSESPFMLRAVRFRGGLAQHVPAVVHADGTARVQTLTKEQNARLHGLLTAFYQRTGVPMLVNTSYNGGGEPLVETPEDALFAVIALGLDGCVLEDRLVLKEPGFDSLLDLYPKLAQGIVLSRRSLPEGCSENGPCGKYVRLSVPTRWGQSVHVLSPHVLPLVQALDGRTRGRDLITTIAGHSPTVEDFRERALAAWSAAAGPGQLVDGDLSPLTIVEALHGQRNWDGSEAGLMRALRGLGRAGAARFHKAAVDWS